MPTIEFSYNDLCELLDEEPELEELKEALWRAKAEFEEAEKEAGDVRMKVEIEDTARPDLWSVEGIARVLRGHYGKTRSMPKYDVKDSGVVVEADEKVDDVRPYTACAVVRGLDLSEEALLQSIQLQEKVAESFGKRREQVAVGIYDLSRIEPPIRYTTRKPDELSFIPLEPEETGIGDYEEMTLAEILEEHPKGREFGHLLEDKDEYPVFIDSEDNVLSMPPIINSQYSGRVTGDTSDVFIECSGFNKDKLEQAVTVIALGLVERGGRLETVEIRYSDEDVITPDMEPGEMEMELDYLQRITGLDIDAEDARRLLHKQQYDVEIDDNILRLTYPSYRKDVMHSRDVVEDVIIAKGYDEIGSEEMDMAFQGEMLPEREFTRDVEGILIGMGLEQISSYTLTNKHHMFDRMRLDHAEVVEIANPVSENWSCFRTWLLPQTMEFLSENRHVEYPQRVFEIGDCVLVDQSEDTKTREVRKLALAVSDSKVSYEEIASKVAALLRTLEVPYALEESQHRSFIDGRTAEVRANGRMLGYVGEIHPEVLNNWGLDKPVLAAELNMDKLLELVEEE